MDTLGGELGESVDPSVGLLDASLGLSLFVAVGDSVGVSVGLGVLPGTGILVGDSDIDAVGESDGEAEIVGEALTLGSTVGAGVKVGTLLVEGILEGFSECVSVGVMVPGGSPLYTVTGELGLFSSRQSCSRPASTAEFKDDEKSETVCPSAMVSVTAVVIEMHRKF